MQKKFIQNLVFLLFLNLLIKPFWLLGIDRAVQNAVGNQEYGFYWALFNFSYIFQIILDFGINSFNNRNIARHHQLLDKYFSSVMLFKLLLTVLYIALLFSVGFIIGYNERSLKILLFLALNQVIASYILYLRSNISGLQYFKTDSMFSVLDRALMIILCSFALWSSILPKPFKIEWFVYIQSISLSITALLSFLFVYSRAGYFKPRFNWAFFMLILKNSYPFAILTLLMSLYTRIDGVMIERLLPDPTGKIEAGIYASGYRILDAANMIAFLFATLLLPIFSRMLQQKEDIAPLVKTSFSLFINTAFILIPGCFFFRLEIMNLLYHHNEVYNANIFGYLMINYISIGSIYIFGTLLTANANLKFLNTISAIGMLINIGLNLILILKFRALGAVMATLATQLVVSGLQAYKAIKLFEIKIQWLSVVKSIGFLTLMIILFYLSILIVPDWKIAFTGVITAGFILIFIFRIINLKELIRLIMP